MITISSAGRGYRGKKRWRSIALIPVKMGRPCGDFLKAGSSRAKAIYLLAWVVGLAVCVFSVNAYAIDSWQLIKEKICSEADLDTTKALQASFFEFKRQDGFECAQRVMIALSKELSTSAEARLGSSRLLWAIFSATSADPGLDANFGTMTRAIRLATHHPLRGEARLAQLRLSVLRGKPTTQITNQLEPILADLRIFEDRQTLNNLYTRGSLPLRESLRWLLAEYAQMRTHAGATASPLEKRLRAHARWGQEAAFIGAASPELLHYIVADAWKGGRRLISPGAVPSIDTSRALPEMSGRLEYSLCASEQCRSQAVDVASVSDQVDEKRVSLNITDALAAIRYSIGSTPIVQSLCGLDGTPCNKKGLEEAGRHYWVSVSSIVVGGASWKDSFFKEAKGIDDRKSNINYQFTAQVNIPQCIDPAQCSPSVIVLPRMIETGRDGNALRTIVMKAPDGSETVLPTDTIAVVDRSSGVHTLQFKLSRTSGQSGSSAAPPNQSTISVSIWSGAKLSQKWIAEAKQALLNGDVAMSDYLPLLLMTRALTLRPEAINESPAYMGLGESLGQYSDKNTSTRWDRVYAPLYFLHLLKTSVAPELTPEERQGIELAEQSLSRVAIDNFTDHVDRQITFLRDLLPTLSVALIDAAIVAIQMEKPLSVTVTPLMQAVLAIRTTGLGLGDEFLSQAQVLINSARAKDNLLEAVLLLYEARERLQQAHEKVALQLELITVEKTGLLIP